MKNYSECMSFSILNFSLQYTKLVRLLQSFQCQIQTFSGLEEDDVGIHSF